MYMDDGPTPATAVPGPNDMHSGQQVGPRRQAVYDRGGNVAHAGVARHIGTVAAIS